MKKLLSNEWRKVKLKESKRKKRERGREKNKWKGKKLSYIFLLFKINFLKRIKQKSKGSKK